MYNEVPRKIRANMKKAAAILNSHKCAVDTMLVSKGNDFHKYQPYHQPEKKPIKTVPAERLEELSHAFQEAHDVLKKEGIELLVCFVSLNEGGASVFVAEDAVKRRIEVFEELKRMEERHAKIS